MIIVIGSKVYDSSQEPMVIVMNAKEKDAVKQSTFVSDTFTHYPTDMDKSKLESFKRKSMTRIRER